MPSGWPSGRHDYPICPDDAARRLFGEDARPVRTLEKEHVPDVPGIYAFTRPDPAAQSGFEVMYVGVATQGLRERIWAHHLMRGNQDWLPIAKYGPNKGNTRQEGGCNLIFALARAKAGDKTLDMNTPGHKKAWRAAVDEVFRLDVRWVIVPVLGAERAARRLRTPTYGS